MNKLLVEIFVPASEMKFDAYIPSEILMNEALKLISSTISELTVGKYKASADAVLCDASTGIIYDINMYVSELGIRNGTKLMLV